MIHHEPVLLNEVLEALQVKKDGLYIDCTLGDGGHTLKILELGGKVLGFDLDDGSLDRATKRIKQALDGKYFDNLIVMKANFCDLEKVALENSFGKVDGILLDLGYSSTQLEDLEVGLSFMKDQPLDMRIDKTLGVTAADLINALGQRELEKLFFEFGEESQGKRFAKAIIEARGLKKFVTTKDLVELIVKISPVRDRIHPATKVFQALRIAVNMELENSKSALPQAAHLLLPGGRMAVISFHSLEDRIVKQFGSVQLDLKLLGRKPTEATEEEVRLNPRSRSAKMRVFEKSSA
ncbi:16S rRNA (cytosine(1402)-N(4))-methyltransferase RsmH [candidate division WWE3 bacterium]|nr:16S rRNA (cytosine(1402)-N(4))-methyltransferase RsmH [candidate division WWE3 bacterium]